MTAKRALVVAGLDPSGGAGLLLDAFVMARLGYSPATIATTVTAQNSATFFGAAAVAPGLLGDQLEAVLAEGPFACAKVGATGSAENARLLEALLGGLGAPVVVDPVLVSSSGGDLVGGADVGALDVLCAAATLVTPNAEEAARLAGLPDERDVEAARAAGGALARRWGCAVLVTGVTPASAAEGGGCAVDVLCLGDSVDLLEHPLVEGVGDVRGTGCMFSSSIAAGLGSGLAMREAVVAAQRNVAELLRTAVPLGAGRMQVDLSALCGERSPGS